MSWISNYVHNKLCDVITDPYPDFNGVVVKQVWIRDCIPYKTMDLFTYPCLNLSYRFLIIKMSRVHTPKTILITPTSKQQDSLPQGRRHDNAIKRKHFPRYRPFVVRVMTCCLTAPSHYLNQCWLTVNEVLWHLFHCNVYLNAQNIYQQAVFEIYTFEITTTSPREHWVKWRLRNKWC